MPPQKSKKKYSYGFKKKSDEKAISLRQEMGLNASDPLDAFNLCKHLSIPIQTPKDIPGMTQEMLTELLVMNKGAWSAASIPLSNNKHLIIHNPKHSYARQQSNIMHELAHIICEHKIPDDKKASGLSGFLRNYDEIHENEAEWFGGCLQLPREALLYCLKNNLTQDEIAIKYNASIEMVRYRINISGVKKQLKYIRK